MRNIHEKLEQIIDNLLLIKNNTAKISSIEKDILLQNLRDAYLLLLRQPVSDETQTADDQEEEPIDNQPEAIEAEKQLEEEVIQEEEQPEEENDEMDSDILEFVKNPEILTGAKAVAEPEIKFEEKPVAEPEPEAVPEPVIEAVPEPEVVPDPEKVEVEISEIPEISEPEPEPMPEKTPESKEENVRKFVQILDLESQSQPEPEKPQQRSLNDLFIEQKQDLGDKFQQTKIADLTKAMSINDKFLFIRELFKNKSEEFSRAIQTLNKCENIEEAFDIMEGLKKQYFWDSTSSAYLSLCDLVRRKF
ncbi:MAG: hypothetical protein J5644_04415 [Bacteroidales bacterium]|nr:hypothetical protein [Bacteroidales bacterium]